MEATATVVATETEKPKRRRQRGQRGSKFQRGNSWVIMYRTREGKQKWEGGFRTSTLAQARLDEVIPGIRSGKYVENSEVLFGTFCDEFMEKVKPDLKPRTWMSYKSALKNWIVPAFGKHPLCDIHKEDVKNFLHRLLGNPDISRKFVKNVHIFLHRLFEDAIEDEKLEANPAHNLKMIKALNAEAMERVVPTPTEVMNTFEKLPPVYQALLATSAVTGARRGELVGLFWDDVDWTRGKIHIQRALQRVTKKLLDAGGFRDVERIGQTGLVLVPPKSKKANRYVDMPSNLAVILRALRASQTESSAPFVFQNEIGAPIDPDAVGAVLTAAQDAAKVRHFGTHGLRHLYCSLLQERAGATLKFAQERMGHADPQTTARIYTHVVNDQGREFAERVESAFPFASVSVVLANPPATTSR